ncbi:MAG: FkbM family methyltransferase [Bacteroidota bacterium]
MKHLLFKITIAVWRLIPGKVFLSKIIKKSPYLKKKLFKDLRFKGEIKIDLGNSSFQMYNPGFTTIENELFWNGLEGWEKISIKIWVELAKQSNVILDIGANTGVYSLIAGTLNKNAKIYSFEPVKRTYSLLENNIAINSFNNIFPFAKAVSNVNSILDFYDVDSQSQSSASLNPKMLEKCTNRISYKVETIALDTSMEFQKLKVDLIKLDVEMHEPEALEGMIQILSRDKPYILVEILTNDIANKIQTLFSSLDYSYYNIDEVNIPQKVETLKPSDHYNYIFIPNTEKFDFEFLRK